LESNRHLESDAMTRTLSRVETTPPPAPGFIGPGHTAVEVLSSTDLDASDPFVLLMDDRLEIPHRRQIGGAHPHAGLETVTLVLEGTLHDRDEGQLSPGDLLWMTAGRGIIHSESIEAQGRSRILQLWIGLSARDRGAAPGFELIRREDAPVVSAPGARVRVYSDAGGPARAATRNRVPVTILDVALDPGARWEHELPASYNGFAYVIEGAARIGDRQVAAGQVGWLAPSASSRLPFEAGPQGVRLVLYAGQPLGEPLVQHGPFVAGSPAEISEFHRRYRAGQFTRMSQLSHHPVQEVRP
jgi:redox-sensitive bicupin YhaK (pirin superfamily)